MLGFDAPYEKEPTFQPAPGEQQPAEDEEKPKEEDPKKKPSPEDDEEEAKNMEGLYVATTDESYDYSELREVKSRDKTHKQRMGSLLV